MDSPGQGFHIGGTLPFSEEEIGDQLSQLTLWAGCLEVWSGLLVTEATGLWNPSIRCGQEKHGRSRADRSFRHSTALSLNRLVVSTSLK
jgi:hypothetical protein